MSADTNTTVEAGGTHVLTPLGVLSLTLGQKAAERAIDALVLHMARNYGRAEAPGMVLRDGQLRFVELKRA